MPDNQLLPVKAVFFDLDDTIFDHLNSTRAGLKEICQYYTDFQEYTLDELFATYTTLLDDVHLQVLEGRMTIDEARIHRFERFFMRHGKKSLDAAEIATAAEHAATLHRAAYQASRQVVTGIVPLLEYLHNRVQIALVTNNIVAEQVDKLQYLKLDYLIDKLVTSEETGSIKPDPGIFRVALERTGCQAEEAVMIGDSWKADVLGARNAGIRALWLNRTGIDCPDPTLAVEFRSFEPLAEMLALIGKI